MLKPRYTDKALWEMIQNWSLHIWQENSQLASLVCVLQSSCTVHCHQTQRFKSRTGQQFETIFMLHAHLWAVKIWYTQFWKFTENELNCLCETSSCEGFAPIFNKILIKCSVYFFICLVHVHVRQSESLRAMISRWNIHLRGTRWRICKVEAFRAEVSGFESRSGHHFESLKKFPSLKENEYTFKKLCKVGVYLRMGKCNGVSK